MGNFLDDLQKEIEKNVKGVHVATLNQSELAKSDEFVASPAYDLNRILTGDISKGLPTRTLCAIVGQEGTFKTSFMILMMAAAQKQGFFPIILDTERSCDLEFAERWGLDTSNAKILYTPWVHNVMAVLANIKETAMSKGQQKLIIGLDSVGNLDLYKSYENALADDIKADQGLLQKTIKGMLRLFLNLCIETNSIGIATGHVYGRPSPVPTPDQIGGGKAMRYLPTVVINLKKEPLKTSSKEVIGNLVHAQTLKNRLYPAFQDAIISIDYRGGIDPYMGLLPIMVEAGLVEKQGNTYVKMSTQEKMGVGENKAYDFIRSDKTLLDHFNEWLKTTGYSNVNENLKAAVELVEENGIDDDDDVKPSKKKSVRKYSRVLKKKKRKK
jgi:recombination protein RecA